MAFHTDSELYIAVSERDERLKTRIENTYTGTHILFIEDLCREGAGKAIYDKYYGPRMDKFRWSMKPVLLTHILAEEGRDKVIYVDCDIQFYSDYRFLFDELNEHNILITPHWRPSDPFKDPEPFLLMYTFGIYNAGFIGVNARSLPAMNWWAKANLFVCEVDPCKGQYVDQTHLNLLHVYFEGVKALKHRGCNVAGWNMLECPRTQRDDTVMISGKWPLVFVHYSSHTITNIESGADPLLAGHLMSYLARVDSYKTEIDPKHLVPPPKEIKETKNGKAALVKFLKRVRRRLKR